MKQATINIAEIKLLGIKTSTCNQDESAPHTAKIASLVMNAYFGTGVPDTIPGRKSPSVTYGIYTEYESDHTGQYTYFIGEEVESLDNMPDGLSAMVISPGAYTKFTTGHGVMPQVIVEAWTQIWQMNDQELGGKRGYETDFEIYHPTSADIFIGIST